MQRTHAPNNVSHSNATETRKGLGTIPSNERYNIGDPRVPFRDVHWTFTHTGGNRVRQRLTNGLQNVTAVYLDSLFCDATPSPAVFEAGIRFKKANNHFTPNIINSDSNRPDDTIWIHPTYEQNALGTGTYIIQDTTPRLLRSYRQAEYISDMEVSLVDRNGNDLPWSTMFINLKFEFLDWQ